MICFGKNLNKYPRLEWFHTTLLLWLSERSKIDKAMKSPFLEHPHRSASRSAEGVFQHRPGYSTHSNHSHTKAASIHDRGFWIRLILHTMAAYTLDQFRHKVMIYLNQAFNLKRFALPYMLFLADRSFNSAIMTFGLEGPSIVDI